MSLKDQITEDMKSAMRAKDSARLGTIRLLLAAIKQKEVDERIVLDDAQINAVIDKMLKQRRDSIEQFQRANRQDLVDQETFELSVLAGYQPEQVDAVVITHMHADHVGGLMAGEQRVFPNATVHADQRDADFWLSTANMEKAPAESKGFFQGAMASLNPYISAGKFKPFNGNTELVPGIKAVSAHGHTPGHSIYKVESKGQTLVLWGDQDSLFDAASQTRVKDLLPTARHETFTGLGHNFFWEQPEAAAQMINGFLAP